MSMISEFVEEIKAKINHKKEYHKNFYEKLGHKLNDNDLHKATQLAFDDCMEFINELAEKYRDVPDTNVGKWIPVSEKLPDEELEVIVSTKTERVKVGIYTKKYGFGMREGFICDDGFMYINTANAWQPLPRPYKGE